MKLPARPRHTPEYAELCLVAVTRLSLGDRMSLGGALGLLHYHDYRPTNDVDAWWEPSATEEERQQIVDAIRTALVSAGEVKVRAWGDVVSIELVRSGKKVFSFQIAKRSVRLQPASPAPWIDVLLDSFPDLVASKMVALVERGAPRDFRDIYSLCQAGLTTAKDCWRWWRERQRQANGDTSGDRARLAIETHLTRIVRYRPLDGIADPEERRTAEASRAWYRKELLDALVD